MVPPVVPLPATAPAPGFLELHAVSKRFPGVAALQQVSLAVGRGEIHALLGENGAGKSTLIKILCGIQRQDEGRLCLEGHELSLASYKDAVAAGIGVVFQEFSLIPYLTAVENIFFGRERTGRLGMLRKQAMRREAQALFAWLGVDLDLDAPVAHLSVAEQQFVEIAKALALNVKVLILDEPTATLTPHEVALLFAIMRELKAQGVSIVFVSHHLYEILAVCVRDGQYIGGGPIADFDEALLVELMVGRKLAAGFPPKSACQAPRPLLEVSDLRLVPGGPANAFTPHAGEILGFAGLVGSGRAELVLGLLGAQPTASKRVRLDGHEVSLADPAQALAHGIGLLPESRKAEGLILDFGIRENMSLNNLATYARHGPFIDVGQERAATRASMTALGIKPPRRGPAGGHPQRRQPAEGDHRPLAQPSLPGTGVRRAHPWHRRRRQGGDSRP